MPHLKNDREERPFGAYGSSLSRAKTEIHVSRERLEGDTPPGGYWYGSLHFEHLRLPFWAVEELTLLEIEGKDTVGAKLTPEALAIINKVEQTVCPACEGSGYSGGKKAFTQKATSADCETCPSCKGSGQK